MIGKLLGWALGLPVAVVAVVFAVVNRAPVSVDLWPLPWQVGVPLYLLSLGTFAAGVVIGAGLVAGGGLRLRARARAAERSSRALQRRLTALETALEDERSRLPVTDSVTVEALPASEGSSPTAGQTPRAA